MALWGRQGLGLGVTLAALGGNARAAPMANAEGDAEDDWLEHGGRKHRIIFDSVSTQGAGEALNFADNFYKANLSGYGVAGKDMSVVIILRHYSVVFGFNDAMWAKYGAALSDWGQLATIGMTPASANVYNA